VGAFESFQSGQFGVDAGFFQDAGVAGGEGFDFGVYLDTRSARTGYQG